MLLVLLVLGALPMTQVHFSETTLDEVARRAEWVVVVERKKPVADWPQRWRVVETLAWRDRTQPAPAPGDISVYQANQDFNDAMAEHLAKHGYQGAPSPVFPRYASSLTDEKFAREKRAILFLRRYKKDWQLAIEGGWESLARRAGVVNALTSSAK